MAHESFEDDEIANLMNDAFISIKVDREERPDIDSIYMTVCQIMNHSGGWPLTIIMTPEKKPFFAGTYIPKDTRFGRMGLRDLIPKIKDLWNNQKEKLIESGEKITNLLQEATSEAPGMSLNEKDLNNAVTQLTLNYDDKYGGFGDHPKFPSPHNLLFLLRIWKRTANTKLLTIVENTLQAMRLGGIYDHIGFGFHRYSTDREWLVPHFEKMLYDQAMLAIAYTEAYQATKKPLYEYTAKEIFSYVLRDMVSEGGGFFSAEDADSEGIEGKFYVWNYDELQALLEKEDLELFTEAYNVTKEGNYREEATQKITGKNILHLTKRLELLANEFNISPEKFQEKIETIRLRLFKEREKRIHPHKDDKILTDWNGLMIAALAYGGYVFNKPKYVEAAKKGVEFILSNLRDAEGRLLHRFRDDNAELKGYLDDYAFFIWGLLNLYEATLDIKYLELAIDMTKDQLNFYWDKEIGAFYFTAEDAEKLITRRKEIYDGAIPSGNSVAMLNLLRLGQLTGEEEYETKADILGRVFAENIRNNALGFSFILSAVDFAVGPTFSLVISGDRDNEDTNHLLKIVKETYLPNKALLFRPTDEESPKVDDLSNYITYFDKHENKATAYVCINKTCKPPTNDAEKMLEYLNPIRQSS